ncbi:cell wall-binding repeat-containing protein [Euzebya sp.]|uniref:cell wall-binding repeat-containing protein n=1 Tax=Euzebya sp. TaxID=1971409 RepID=UPI003512880F
MRRVTIAGVVAVLVGVAALPVAADGVTETSDTLSIVKEGTDPSNAQIAVDLLTETPLTPDRVLIGRDDVFVDSMAAGVLQDESPLLLVPPAGPVPAEVMAALEGTGASRVTLLGGESAVQAPVADELAAAGYAVDRRAGDSRFETAVAIARDAGPSDTAILVRAFEAPGATDPTQAFADSLAAGYMAAENGWPILLTQTDVLSGPTRDFLAEQAFDRVLILGGTAPVSDAVAGEVAALAGTVDRIAGPDRFTTGVEIAKETGAESAADVARVTLVEGQGADAWAGGFAAAAHAAHFDAPIVLTTGESVPGPTEAWLAGGGFAQVGGGVRVTCVTPFAACAEGRQALDLPPLADVTFDPPTGATVATGSAVAVSGAPSTASVSGSCVGDGGSLGDGQVTITAGGPTCDLVVTFPLDGGATQTETATYAVGGGGAVELISAGPDGTAVGGRYADASDDGLVVAFLSDGDPTGAGTSGVHVYALDEAGEVHLVDARPDGTAGGGIIPSGDTAPQVIGEGRYSVVFAAPDPGLDTGGAVGSSTGTNVYVRDLTSGDVRLLSVDGAGEPVADAVFGAASADGRTYTFTGTGAAADGANPSRHIFIHRQFNGTTDVVRDHTGAPFANADPGDVVISADGSTLAFSSERAELVAGDTNARPDVYAYDVAAQAIERVNVTADGAEATGGGAALASHLGITADGDRVIFTTTATNLGPGAGQQVVLRERGAGRTAPIVVGAGEQLAPSISADGSLIALVSTESPPGSGDQGCGVYLLDVETAEPLRLHGDTPGNLCPTTGTSVGAGGEVVFDSSTALVGADQNTVPDIYRAVVPGG